MMNRRIELIKSKKFRDELRANLFREIFESNDMNISEREVNKKVKKIFDELINEELEERYMWIEN
ncbi:MAG: hypothetical protein QXO84_02005 [Candidatus Aenigmatarchaeota archaeon]